MADIDIHFPHPLGLTRARAAMRQWLVRVEHNYGLVCRYQEDPHGQQDEIEVTGAGSRGTVHVRADVFDIQVELGPLAKLLAPLIEDKLRRHLDALLDDHAAPRRDPPAAEAG